MDNHHIIWASAAVDDISDNLNYPIDYPKEDNIEYNNDNLYGATATNNSNRSSQYPSWNYYPNTTDHSMTASLPDYLSSHYRRIGFGVSPQKIPTIISSQLNPRMRE